MKCDRLQAAATPLQESSFWTIFTVYRSNIVGWLWRASHVVICFFVFLLTDDISLLSMTGATASQADVQHHCIRHFGPIVAIVARRSVRREFAQCVVLGQRTRLSWHDQHTGRTPDGAQRQTDEGHLLAYWRTTESRVYTFMIRLYDWFWSDCTRGVNWKAFTDLLL